MKREKISIDSPKQFGVCVPKVSIVNVPRSDSKWHERLLNRRHGRGLLILWSFIVGLLIAFASTINATETEEGLERVGLAATDHAPPATA